MMKKRLLFITAFSLEQFGGAVRNNLKNLEYLGFEVDLLTLYSFHGQKSNHYSIYPRTKKMMLADIRRKLSRIPFLKDIYYFLHKPNDIVQKSSSYLRKGNNVVVLEDESLPRVNNELILSKVNNIYDYFILFGWQNMMSSSTVEALYDRYHKPILIPCPDMYQLTGNCFYTADCEKYKDECHNCPVFADRENKEQAHLNFLYKKRVYKKTGCYLVANSHQKKYILNSGIIDDDHILLSNTIIDTDIFKPQGRVACMKKFGLNQDVFYVLLRYINPNSSEYVRKGLHLLDKVFKIVYSQLSCEEREKLVVMFAGTNEKSCKISYDFKTIALGNLDLKNLIRAYNASSVFVCPSLDDAGPSMVNQSIACGTPVIAFNQGTALDVIEDGYNGFKADVGDFEALAQNVLKMFRMRESDLIKMRENAREISLKKNSFESNSQRLKERFLYIDKHFKG